MEDEELTPCACRWRAGEYVACCELHQAWREAIHDWAERAKEAEALLVTKETLRRVGFPPPLESPHTPQGESER